MPPSRPRVYLDSCCYIDVAKGRMGIPFEKPGEEERPELVWYIETLLLAASNRDIEIVASTLVIAECLHTETRDNIPEAAKETLRSLLSSGNPVLLIAADFFVCERARDLLWNDKIFCGGVADQIHVATALDLRCEEFITTNRKRGPLQGDRPAQLAKLNLRVILPDQTTVLPPQYTKPLLTPQSETTSSPDGSTASAPPSGLSVFVDPATVCDSEQGRPSDPQADRELQQQGSSPPAPPPPQSEK
jgi:predicted nucleic acid-binding protein